ncbi:MAG: polysaccharide biosynthesis tyrosine autokinase [Proteobacteria bacterium]|nr:polysaccharide biosynthesis tyrosine autokinase [Pseudomonadota bacterium]
MGKISDALEKSIREQNKKEDASLKIGNRPQADMAPDFETIKPRNDAGGFSDDPVSMEKAPPPFEKLDRQLITGELHPNLITYYSPHTVEAEQFRIIKTNIMFPEKGDPPKTIMVTSAVPGEGKSFVAGNLAISLAQNIDNHVLLIDCDMRLPTIHKLFGFKDSISGLSSYLTGDASLPSLFVKTVIDKLTVLPGGKPPHNPSELLSSERMAHLLDELKTRYNDRYVVIDTPPPQLTAEANAIAKRVDGIILVIKYGSTSRLYIKELVEMFGKDKILGIVFNQFDTKASVGHGYTYGQYGAYGGYYGNTKKD